MPLTPSGFQDDRYDLVTVSPGNPAVGSGLHWPCPANRVIHVVGVYCSLLTLTAVVINRWMYVDIENAGLADAMFSPSIAGQPQMAGWNYHWTVGVTPRNFFIPAPTLTAPLGACYQLKTGDFLNIRCLNMQATDQITDCCLRYYEWNED